MRGESDEKLLEVDALGNEVRVLKETEGEKGKDLVVSVRSDWQREVHHFLQEGIKQYSATGGVVILQEVQTGRILSIVSLPSYDNQLFAGGISERDFQALLGSTEQPLFNRSIAGVYPPGSVVKPAVAAAALKEGIINETTKLSDFPQIIKIGVWEFPDWTIAWNRGAHGIIDVKEALAYSCDTFFYKIGGGFDGSCDGFANGCYSRGLGVEKIASVFRLVGFGQATGIDLPGEGEGLVPDQEWKMRVRGEPWFLGNTYHLSIGQGDLLTTPVQIVNYVSAIANGGRLMRPVLGLQIKGARGEVQSLISPEVIKEAIIQPDILSTLGEGMRLAVSHGIISPLREAGVEVAAKTGTAEFGTKNANGEYETHAWVTGFFPFDDPKISFVVLLESGGKSNNAAQVARDLIDWIVGRGQI